MEHYSAGTLLSHDGLRLNLHCWGDRRGTPLLLLHGGGQTAWAWQATARRLAVLGYYCLAPDLRGHGESDWAGDGGYGAEDFALDARLFAHQAEVPPVAIGASLGGMSALLAEAGTGGLFSALVLVDITPSWEPQGVERIMSFMEAFPDGFADLEEAAEAVRRYLPHRARSVRASGLRKSLYQHRNGRWFWRWDPSMLNQAREMLDHWPPRLEEAAAGLELPTLLVSGGRSDVVSERTATEFTALVPHAEHVCIDDAHHMVAGDSNDAFGDAIIKFLTGVSSRKTA